VIIRNLRAEPSLRDPAALWFSEKWGIPLSAYQESMDDCIGGVSPVPQWYVMLDGEKIVGGMGVIENDFHPRTDLAPNVCAVFTEPDYRCRGIAGKLLQHVCEDMHGFGVDTLYLLTDHTGFYERYGWRYLCPVTGDGEEEPSRMYIHEMK